MKVIVFGGSGFLGSHIADQLTSQGFEVSIFDKKSSLYLVSSQKMIVGDILDQEKVDKAVKGCDIVYNFAGISDIDEASRNPLESVKCNILGNTVILEAARKAHIKRYIYASSLYVYSKKGSFYRSTKQACESLIENYQEIYGLPYTILRYGSLYGPRTTETNIIYAYIKQALLEGKIVREGDGEEIREYIHVYDAAKSSVEILKKEHENQTVIITGNQQMKVKNLLFMIKEILDNKITIKFTSPRSQDHYEITPYTFIPKLGKCLVNDSYIDFGQGILDMIQDIYKNVHPDSKLCEKIKKGI